MTICKFALSFVIIQFCLVYFIVGIIPVLTSRSSFVSCIILKKKNKKQKTKNSALGVYLFLITFLMALQILQVHLVYFLPQSSISHFSKESWFFFERVLLKPRSGHRCAHSYWNVFTFRPFRMTQKENLSCDFYPFVWDKRISWLEQFQSTEELAHGGFLFPQGSLSCSAESVGGIAISLLLFTLENRRLGRAGSPYIPRPNCFFQVHCCPS